MLDETFADHCKKNPDIGAKFQEAIKCLGRFSQSFLSHNGLSGILGAYCTEKRKPKTDYQNMVNCIMRFSKVEPDDQRHEIASTID